MSDDKYYIYKYTNKLNGMVYIGKSKRIRQRIWQHMRCYEKEDSLIHRDIKKYGIENFDVDIIDETDNEKDSVFLERFYIEKYNSIYPNGYNQNRGGVGGHNARAVVCLELDGTFVKRYYSAGDAKKDGYSDSDVLLCCKNIQKRVKDKLFMFEDDYKKNGAKKYIKPESTCKKSIIQCDKQGVFIKEFDSIANASLETGIQRTTIVGVLKGTYKSAGGYIFVYKENYPIKNIDLYKKRKKGRRIKQVDVNTGEIVAEFERIADAGRSLGVCYKNIHFVLDKPDRTAYGYKWIST